MQHPAIRFTPGAVGLACALSVSLACAQALPSPEVRQQGEQQERRQQEREAAQRGQLQRGADAAAPAVIEPLSPWPEHESPCFPIRDLVLDGESVATFGWVLDGLGSGADAATNRCLGVEGINVVAARAQRALLARGFVTSRIVVRAQDLSTGRLALTVLPGRIHAIRFAQDTATRATAANAVPARPGDILNLRDIEQALENFKRVPTVSADIQIAPATSPNESDLVIAWQQAFAFRLNTTLDDSGTKATGKYQGSATLSYDHAFTLNDLFYATLNHDVGGNGGGRGTHGHTVHYSVPWGYWLLGITSARSDYYQRVAGPYQDYIYSGTSQNADLKLSRLVYRDAVRKTTLSLKGWLKRTANFIDDTEIQPQRNTTGGWELGATHRESIGHATLEASLAHRRGTAAFGALPAPGEVFGEGTSRMRVTTAEVSLNAPFSLAQQSLRYQATYRGQWNSTPLTPQDRFAIGGRYTVRGFDGESSLSAERGWLVRNDLAIALGGSGQEAYLGLDYGQVRGPATGWLVGDHLAGAVAGLRGGSGRISYDVFVGRPVSRPAYFRTASVTAGFSLSAAF